MQRLGHTECVDGLALEVNRFAALVDAAKLDAQVPTCPEWSVSDLVLHLGVIHRWVTRMVSERTPERIPRVEAEYSHPEGPDELAGWFREGAAELVETLQACEANALMWAWDPALGVSFWSRRQLHETAMHRIDLALACGMPTELDREIARDSMLELFEFIPLLGERVPHLMELCGNGETIALRATDGDGFGTITLTSNGFQIDGDLSATDATVSGSMSDLAMTISRRLAVTDPKIKLSGRMDLVGHWIAHSALD